MAYGNAQYAQRLTALRGRLNGGNPQGGGNDNLPGGGPNNKPNINPNPGMMWQWSNGQNRWIQVQRPGGEGGQGGGGSGGGGGGGNQGGGQGQGGGGNGGGQGGGGSGGGGDNSGAGPAPIPYSSDYETRMGVAGLRRDQTLTGLEGERVATRQQYGFDDTSNPFSIARGLERANEQRVRGTGNNYAASGQLYAGSLSNARTTDRYTFESDLDSAQRAYAAKLAENARLKLETQNTYTDATLDAKAAALEAALSEAPDPAEAPGKPGKGDNEGGGGQGGGGSGGGGSGGGGSGGGGSGGGGGGGGRSNRPPRPTENLPTGWTWLYDSGRGRWVKHQMGSGGAPSESGGGQGGGNQGGGGDGGGQGGGGGGGGSGGGGGGGNDNLPGGGPNNKPNINPNPGMMWKWSDRENRWIQVRRV